MRSFRSAKKTPAKKAVPAKKGAARGSRMKKSSGKESCRCQEECAQPRKAAAVKLLQASAAKNLSKGSGGKGVA